MRKQSRFWNPVRRTGKTENTLRRILFFAKLQVNTYAHYYIVSEYTIPFNNYRSKKIKILPHNVVIAANTSAVKPLCEEFI